MANISLGDAACDRRRTLIETIEGGDQPEMRECPTCHGSGLRAASCWAQLEPLADAPRSQV